MRLRYENRDKDGVMIRSITAPETDYKRQELEVIYNYNCMIEKYIGNSHLVDETFKIGCAIKKASKDELKVLFKEFIIESIDFTNYWRRIKESDESVEYGNKSTVIQKVIEWECNNTFEYRIAKYLRDYFSHCSVLSYIGTLDDGDIYIETNEIAKIIKKDKRVVKETNELISCLLGIGEELRVREFTDKVMDSINRIHNRVVIDSISKDLIQACIEVIRFCNKIGMKDKVLRIDIDINEIDIHNKKTFGCSTRDIRYSSAMEILNSIVEIDDELNIYDLGWYAKIIRDRAKLIGDVIEYIDLGDKIESISKIVYDIKRLDCNKIDEEIMNKIYESEQDIEAKDKIMHGMSNAWQRYKMERMNGRHV